MTAKGTKINRKYFNEWAKDLSPLLATASLTLAKGAEDYSEFLQMFKSRQLSRKIPFCSTTDEWLSLYRNHRSLYKGVSAALRALDRETSEVVDFYEFLMKCFNESRRMDSEERRKLLESLPPEQLKEMFTAIQKDAREMQDWVIRLFEQDDNKNSKQLSEKTIKRRIKKFLNTPEIVFYLRLWIPCFLIYGIYPPKLLWKARRGDEDALEKLIRLDKLIIYDPKIKEMYQKEKDKDKSRKLDMMAKTILREPKIKTESQSVKYALAALISISSIALGQRLTDAKINKLFDAIAKDSGKGIIDDDLAVSPETFEKAIQRYSKFWQVIPRQTANN